jgi:hypothetical protein
MTGKLPAFGFAVRTHLSGQLVLLQVGRGQPHSDPHGRNVTPGHNET